MDVQNTQSSVKGIDKENSTLIEYKQVKDTPFTVAKIERENEELHDYYIMMGKYRISEKFENEEEVMEEAGKIDWWKIMGVIHAIASEIVNNKDN